MRRIFIIGPMSDTTGERLPNIGNIEEALKIVFREFASDPVLAVELEREPVQIDGPLKKYGSDIPEDVFSAIDMSDLVIADVGHRSPNVMYELAFAHALGLSTILIDLSAAGLPGASLVPPKNLFYLSQTRRIENIATELKPTIEDWLRGKSNLTENPLTKFYSIALVDISAVTGIAVGYAENFIVPLITAIQGPIEQRHDGKPVARPRHIIVVLPETLDNLRQEELDVEAALDKEFAQTSLKRLTAQTAKGPRTVPYYAGGIFVDIPRTIIPLNQSPRMKRLLKSNPADAAVMERKLIDVFGQSLQQVAKQSSEISRDLLHIVRRRQLLETIRALMQSGG